MSQGRAVKGGAVTTRSHIGAVQALVADAVPIASWDGSRDPEPGEPLEGVLPGQWVPDALGLPPGCPVIPLGYDGRKNWFIDACGQLFNYEKPFGQADTVELFRGRHNWLKWAWPRYTKDLSVDNWKNEQARDCLLAAIAAKGPWNATEKVRGRGCWPDGRGGIVAHLGNAVIASGQARKPGELHGYVYPARPPLPGPYGWPRPIEILENPAAVLRLMLSTWSWARPDVDPHLLIGWVGVAFLGAALPWRANVYLTGDKGSGKSTLQAMLQLILGPWVIPTTNTTAAGIYQHVGQDSLAVAVDEFEADEDNRRAVAVLDLARQASSGSQGLRGGDRGTGSEFTLRSAFLFSSINMPPLQPADVSRFALLRLMRLRDGTRPPVLDATALGILGRQILRRLLEEWPRFEETKAAFSDELAAGGMDGRSQAQFGTLLTLADMIEHQGWDPDRLATTYEGDVRPWRDVLNVRRMAEFAAMEENWRDCLDYLLTVPVDAWRNGTRTTIGQVLEGWVTGDDELGNDVKAVRKLLGQAGVTLDRRGRAAGGDWLVIPNKNPTLRRLFEGSKWVGAANAGGWSQALQQAPRDALWMPGQHRVAGVKSRCTLISLDALYGAGGIMCTDDNIEADEADSEG